MTTPSSDPAPDLVTKIRAARRFPALTRHAQEAAIGDVDQPTLERSRIVNTADAQIAALYALCIVVSAAKRSALKLMQNYPEHVSMCQAIADFATDGEGDIRGALAKLDEEERQR
jgi:hypothetical protein